MLKLHFQRQIPNSIKETTSSPGDPGNEDIHLLSLSRIPIHCTLALRSNVSIVSRKRISGCQIASSSILAGPALRLPDSGSPGSRRELYERLSQPILRRKFLQTIASELCSSS